MRDGPDCFLSVLGFLPSPFLVSSESDLVAGAVPAAEPLTSRRVRLPVGRWGHVEEIGALACYLCSDLAGFVTGTDILIDGGWTAA